MSRLRARCPDCRTLTAVALGPEYECHSCGREFPAALVRVPRAWGRGGEAMAAAAALALPYPEADVVDEPTLAEQNLALAAALPERPVVVGGCCCAHVGAVEGIAARHVRVGVVWLDAHGDLNTPASSPSGNAWGMPLRMLIDGGAVRADDVALVGARKLDPPEEEFIASAGVHREDALLRALRGTDGVYVALDLDVLDPADATPWMPEPDGLRLEDAERLLAQVRDLAPVFGAGVTGATPEPGNLRPAHRLLTALGF